MTAGTSRRSAGTGPELSGSTASAAATGHASNVVVPLQKGDAGPAEKTGPAQKTANARWRGFGANSPSASSTPVPDPVLTVQLPAIKAGKWRSSSRPETSAFHGTGLLTDAWDDPRSMLGTAIMQIRDRLVLEETTGANRKVVVIGLGPGAGTSLVSLNLALASAREKATPVLIDLASGPSSLSACFAADAELGAEDVISGATGLIRAALQDDETGTFFLPRPANHQRKPAPSVATLASGLFGQTRRFDSIIVDAGAITDGALPYMLAELADDIVIVAPATLESKAARRLVVRALGRDGEKVRVVVFNALPSGA